MYDLIVNLIASFIAFLLGYLWKDYLKIKIASLNYHGIEIDGIWKASQNTVTAKGYPLTYPSEYTFDIKQTASKIYGEAKAEFGIEHKEIVCYEISGTIKDRFVSLHLTLKDKKRISHSNFLLEVVGNGGKMKGFMSFYALMSEEINAIEILCVKVG